MNQNTQSAPDTAESSEVVVMLTLQFKAGSSEEVLRRMVPSIRLTRAEPGNNEFQFFKVKGGEDKFVVFERWKNQSALEQHWQQLYTKDTLELFSEYLARPLSQTEDMAYLHDVMKSKG
jgi:quinol monooxygenase YgiN